MTGARRSGVLLPLFSMRSSQSWGIGEFMDFAGIARWLELAGQSFVQILPIHEMPPGERSPYSSFTAMALDPIYLSIGAVPDITAIGGEDALDDDERATLADVRQASTLDYRRVRSLKDQCLRRGWDRFKRAESARGSIRAAQFDAFVADQAWWLDEYALFRALSAYHAERAWWEWPEPLANRDDDAVRDVAAALDDEIRYRKYLQWLASGQWEEARRLGWPVRVFGDLPFMVSAHSPDVWARQDQFRRDATVGVPPDAFSENGQDWGLPPWLWERMAESDFAWIRARAARSAAIYDGIRLDHLVGLYRTYIRPLDPCVEPYFAPADEPSQLALGETLVKIYQSSGVEITAEDLGTVPDFVRESLVRLEVPGYKVLRWERRWNEAGQPFIDPGEYPDIAVATPGTHDNEPLAEWWTLLADEDRAAVLSLPAVAREIPASIRSADATLTPPILDALTKALLASPSRIVILPIQDIFGWRGRINTPGTISDANWSWRMPWGVEGLAQEKEPLERAATLLRWTREAGR